MNTEKLLSITQALILELNEYRLLPVLTELVELLKQGDDDRGRIEQLLDTADEISSAAPSNDWPPSATLMLRRIGGHGLVGTSAFDRLQALMSDYRLSSAATANLVAELHKEILQFEGSLKNLLNTARRLGLEPVGIEPGATEVGIILPLPKVVADLESLSDMAEDLDGALRVFGELGGDSGSPRIRQISTSSLILFLSATASVGAILATAISKSLDLYSKKLEIEKTRLEIEKLKLEVSAAEELRKKEKVVIGDGLDALADELVAISEVKDQGRINELKTATRRALMFLIVSMERGVVFEVSSSATTSTGEELGLAEGGGGSEALEAQQLALAAEQGSAMRDFAIQASLIEIPEKANSNE